MLKQRSLCKLLSLLAADRPRYCPFAIDSVELFCLVLSLLHLPPSTVLFLALHTPEWMHQFSWSATVHFAR